MTTRFLAFLCAILGVVGAAMAQAPQPNPGPAPAQMGLTYPTAGSPVLYVLDPTNNWSALGTLNTALHTFSPDLGVGNGATAKVSFPTHAALVAGAPSASQMVVSIEQQGFYAAGDGGWASYDWSAASTVTADGVFAILPSGQSSGVAGRYMLRVPAEGIHPEAAGAYCNTPVGGTVANDDATAIQNLINYLSNSGVSGGTVVFNTHKNGTTCVINSANLTVDSYVKLKGVGLNSAVGNASQFPSLQLNSAYSVVLNGGSALENIEIWRQGLASQPSTVEGIYAYQQSLCDTVGINWTTGQCNSGTTSLAISVGQRGAKLNHVRVIGFHEAVKLNNAPQTILDDFLYDGANGVELTSTGDITYLTNIRGQTTPYVSNLASYVSTYTATVVNGGTGYVTGDTVTFPAGTGSCTTAPTATVTASGGAISTLTMLDTGACTAADSPETWGASSSTLPVVYAGGSGGSNGSAVITISAPNCISAPTWNATISGGALVSVNSVASAGSCEGGSIPVQLQTVSGGSLSGAQITSAPVTLASGVVAPWGNSYWAKNAISLSGGSGSGATATPSVISTSFRPGIGLWDHSDSSGSVISKVEIEGAQTSEKIDTVTGDHFYSLAGENYTGSWNVPGVGLDLENCDGGVSIIQSQFTGNSTSYLLNNTCGVTLMDVRPGGGGSFPNASNWNGIVTGSGSSGTILGLYGGLGSQNGSPPVVQIGSGSGAWSFPSLANTSTANIPADWLGVAPTAAVPFTPQQSPWVVGTSSVPMLIPPTGTAGNNGAVTLGTALNRAEPNLYSYWAADTITATNAAGWYFTQCSSATACTVYNNTYSSGNPTIPSAAQLVAFSSTGPGAYTGVTSAQTALSIPIPAYAMGSAGRLEFKYMVLTYATANNKNVNIKFGGSSTGSYNIASSTNVAQPGVIGVQNLTTSTQVVTNSLVTGGYGASSAPSYLGINTNNAQSLSVNLTLNTATDWEELVFGSAVIYPSLN
jgi:hypothetical protein